MTKVCLVTGATGALGRAIARGLASRGERVVLLASDARKLDAARREIAASTGNRGLDAIACDLSDLDAVRAAAERLRATHERLDVLVHATALFTRERHTTGAGHELMLATNHLGPLLLARELEGPLAKAGGARVLFVLTAPAAAPLDLDDLQSERSFRAPRAFGATRTASLLAAYELARRWEELDIHVNAVDPGRVKGETGRAAAAPARWLAGLLSATPDEAAASVVRLALDPAFAEGTGALYRGTARVDEGSPPRDEEMQRRLWDLSEALSAPSGSKGP